MERYLLDTSAILAHYRSEHGADLVQSLFEDENKCLLLSSASIPEFGRRLRDLGLPERQIIESLKEYCLLVENVISIDRAVAELAFEIHCGMTERLPMVDALIAGCAKSERATLVHRDAHMRAIPSGILDSWDLESGTKS